MLPSRPTELGLLSCLARASPEGSGVRAKTVLILTWLSVAQAVYILPDAAPGLWKSFSGAVARVKACAATRLGPAEGPCYSGVLLRQAQADFPGGSAEAGAPKRGVAEASGLSRQLLRGAWVLRGCPSRLGGEGHALSSASFSQAVKNQSLTEMVDEEAMSQIRKGHETMCVVLTSRHKNLDTVRAVWSTGDIKVGALLSSAPQALGAGPSSRPWQNLDLLPVASCLYQLLCPLGASGAGGILRRMMARRFLTEPSRGR